MPNPQLEPKERMDIIAWLLSDQGSLPPPSEHANLQIADGDLEGVAKAYLEKALPKSMLDNGGFEIGRTPAPRSAPRPSRGFRNRAVCSDNFVATGIRMRRQHAVRYWAPRCPDSMGT